VKANGESGTKIPSLEFIYRKIGDLLTPFHTRHPQIIGERLLRCGSTQPIARANPMSRNIPEESLQRSSRSGRKQAKEKKPKTHTNSVDISGSFHDTQGATRRVTNMLQNRLE
jgi:hypothetical protein